MDPLERSKEDYSAVIEKIASNSSVGIDAQYTHAIIIEYLKDLTQRMARLEELIENQSK